MESYFEREREREREKGKKLFDFRRSRDLQPRRVFFFFKGSLKGEQIEGANKEEKKKRIFIICNQ